MALELKKTADKKTETRISKSRRSFLKKSVYAAPTLIVLGSLIKPEEVKAGFGGPPSDPDSGNGGW